MCTLCVCASAPLFCGAKCTPMAYTHSITQHTHLNVKAAKYQGLPLPAHTTFLSVSQAVACSCCSREAFVESVVGQPEPQQDLNQLPLNATNCATSSSGCVFIAFMWFCYLHLTAQCAVGLTHSWHGCFLHFTKTRVVSPLVPLHL